MASTSFHVTVNGPVGTAFTSFPSSQIAKGDPSGILLSLIRKKCGISNKLFFTVDGKSPIEDNLSLAYYMSLTPEGTKILNAVNPKAKEGEKSAAGETSGKDAADKPAADKSVATDKLAAESSVLGFTVNVAGKDSAPEPLLPLPAKNEALAKLAASIGKDSMALGKLPTFDNTDLASLKGNYAALASTKDYIHPANMKESDWSRVLANNRALYGYRFDFTGKNAIRKAKKRAFKLQGRASLYDEPEQRPVEKKIDDKNATAKVSDGDDQIAKLIQPPIPPFYICDDASVVVTETRDQSQATLTKQGFSSKAVEMSLGGGAKGVAGSAEASYAKEQSTASQNVSKTDVQSLMVTYNFPRVVIELDYDSLELTEECKQDAMNVTSKADVEKFFRNYGNVFVCTFALGGYLQSTRNVSSSEQSNLTQIKNTTRASAGLSIQTPKVSASVNYSQTDSNSTDEGKASLHQDARLAWDARGGDTVLCSNPPAWASTVKDFNLWRLMDQQQIVSMEGLIRDIDSVAWFQLENPSAKSNIGADITKDAAANDRAREIILYAWMEPDTSALISQMRAYYQNKKLDTQGPVDVVNKYLKEKYPGETDLLLTPGLLFGGLSSDKVVGLGLYMIAKGDLKVA